MTNWIVLDTWTQQTDQPDPDGGEWSWQGGDTTYINGAHITRDEFRKDYDSIETELEHGFVVAVAYTDGGTFGYSGNAQPLAAFATPQEAKDFIEKVKPEGRYYTDKVYANWTGYFASLVSLDYYEF